MRHQPNFNDGVDSPDRQGHLAGAPFGDGDYTYSGSPSDADLLKKMLDAAGLRWQ